MATESSEQYDTSSQIVWTGPRVVIDTVIVTDLETEYCNVANDFLAFVEKAGDLIRIQQQQIDYLEIEVSGLERTNALHLGIIDAQAARIKSLEAQLASLAPAIVHSATDNLG